MKKLLPSLIVAALLTACGGGGSDSPAPAAAPVATAAAPAAPAAAAAPAPAAPAPVELASAPATPTGMSYTVGKLTASSTGTNYPVTFNGMTDLVLTGNLNNVWLAAALPGGTVTISGGQNTLVFRPSSTPTTVTVTGSANTFYLPEGSTIKLEGAGAAMSTIKFYKP